MTNTFLYTYIRHGDEIDLCKLEMRAFFGFDVEDNVVVSPVDIHVNRSPFLKERLTILFECNHWEELVAFAKTIDVQTKTFRTFCMNTMVLNNTPKKPLEERRRLERELASNIEGEPELKTPHTIIGFVEVDGCWYIGLYEESEPIWHLHQKKPHSYSTALSTKVARTVANIAVPFPKGKTVIDPCCGVGNVLVEALSMGFNIVGKDINSLMIKPIQENIAHFGYECDVQQSPIANIKEHYDVAIIDMPYNIFLKTTPENQLDILTHARRIAKRVVIVTIDDIEDVLQQIDFTIVDRSVAKKGHFIRQILVCE